MRQSWTKQKVREMILGLWAKEGKINSNYVQVNHSALYGAALRLYKGGWPSAIRAAGLNYVQLRARPPFRRWSQKVVIAEIKRRKRKKLSLNGATVYLEDRELYWAAKVYFGKRRKGGWNKALQEVGLSSRKLYKQLRQSRRRWTKEKVLKEIRCLYEGSSRLDTQFLRQHGYGGLLQAGVLLFRSWHYALEAARLENSRIQRPKRYRWPAEVVIEEIKRLESLGVRLSLKATQRTRADLVGAAIRRFGSWSQAVEAAGFNYQEHCLLWSTKAWLRKLSQDDVKELTKTAEELSHKWRK